MKTTTDNLIKGANILAALYPGSEVTAIQFEDGSGYKFNFQLNSGKWQFADLYQAMQA